MDYTNEEELKKKYMAKYDTLTLTNDFLFGRIMVSNPDLCKRMLEIILGKEIEKIKFIDSQKTLKYLIDGRGIRMDIYLRDEENTVYNVEMQTSSLANMPKRTRYYHSMIDINNLEQSKDYTTLNDVIVIFICTFDPYHDNLYRYTIRSTVDENPNLKFNDGRVTILLNTKGNVPEDQKEMAAFLHFLETGIPTSEFTEELDKKVIEAKANHDWRADYMIKCIKEQDIIRETRAEDTQNFVDQLYKMVQKSILSLSDAANGIGLSEDEFMRIAKRS